MFSYSYNETISLNFNLQGKVNLHQYRMTIYIGMGIVFLKKWLFNHISNLSCQLAWAPKCHMKSYCSTNSPLPLLYKLKVSLWGCEHDWQITTHKSLSHSDFMHICNTPVFIPKPVKYVHDEWHKSAKCIL